MHLQCSGSNIRADLRDLDPDAHLDLGFGSKHMESIQLQPNSSFHKLFSENPLQKEAPSNYFLFNTVFVKNAQMAKSCIGVRDVQHSLVFVLVFVP